MALDLARELEKTLHIHSHDLPYVEFGEGTSICILQARPEDGIFTALFKAEPFAFTELHMHRTKQPVVGFTLKGAWGHDHQYLYRPGTYIYETPGVVHQFLNGPEVTEAIFFGAGAVDFVHPDTLEVTKTITTDQILQVYIRRCEELGFKAHFLT